MAEIIYSQSPHIRSGNSTRKVMLNVCIALLPCFIMGIIYFGLPALLTVLTAVISAALSEIIYRLITKEKFKNIISEFDFSSIVTGMIIGLIIPANYYLYVPVFASVFAIIVVKMLFGGTGKNLVNPAAAGRIFAFVSFTAILDNAIIPSINAIKPSLITSATALKSFLADGKTMSNLDLFLGTGLAGCIGETCKVAIILGWIYLAARKYIKWYLPVIAVSLLGLTTVALEGFDFSVFLPGILSGGFMFAAVFMATDYVTGATTELGKIIYFSVFGILTAVLRKYTGFETASFVILLCNIIAPLINKITTRKPFGFVKQAKGDKK